MLFRNAVCCCLLVLTAGVLPSLGQMRPSGKITLSIAGNVRDDSDQHTMENVRVDLKSSTDVPVNSTFTRGNGEFEFAGLSNGEYVIEVDLKDYEPMRQTVSLFNSSRRGISINLSRPVTMVNSRSSSSISAHQLSVPHKAHDEFDKGCSLMYGKSDFQGAILQFQRAIKDFPTYYEAYALEGSAYLELGQAAPAEEAMRKSVELSSGRYSEALVMLAGLLTNAKRYSEAATTARQAIEVDSASWRGPFELSRALAGLKQDEEAEKSAIEARDMKPDNPPVYLMLANIHVRLHDYPALLRDLDAYLKLVPNGPDADQARETRDNLQATKQQAATQAKTQDNPHPVQDAPRASATSPEPVTELPPPPDPDSSGLSSLPPPVPDNQ